MRLAPSAYFDLLLDIAGRGGRGPRLFGESIHSLREVCRETLLSGANPAFKSRSCCLLAAAGLFQGNYGAFLPGGNTILPWLEGCSRDS